MWSKFTPLSYDPLPLSVPHHPMEPATSYISRLAARNGLKSVLEFCRDIRFPYSALVAGDHDAIKLLAQLSGCDADAFFHASIRNAGGNAFRLRNEMATAQSLQRSRIRICPSCVQEDVAESPDVWRAWRRVSWQFTSIRSCATHQCQLITLPAETSTLRGYDFAAQMRRYWPQFVQSVPQPGRPSSFEGWLTGRIGGARGDGWIDRLELNVATRACEVLGLRLLEGPSATLSGNHQGDWARYADAGHQIISGGVSAFERALSDMLEANDVDRRFFAKVYGPLTTWLKGRGLGDEFEPLKSVVRDHVFANFAVRRGVLVLGRPSAGKTGNALPFVTDDFSEPLSTLMLKRGLASVGEDGAVVPAGFVTRSMIKALKREIAGERGSANELVDKNRLREIVIEKTVSSDAALTADDVVKRLKVTKPTVLYLCRSGLLKQLHTNECRRDGAVLISEKSVATFASRYVSLGRIVAKRRCRQGALAIKLKNADIPMLAMPPRFSRIYRRSDLRGFIP